MLSRRQFTVSAAALLAAAHARPTAWAAPLDLKGIEAFYKNAIVIDSLSTSNDWNDVEFAALKKSGYTGIIGSLSNRTLEIAANAISEWQNRIRQHADKFILATRAQHYRDAKASGKLAVMLNFQNSVMLEGRTENLDLLHGLGMRCMQLTYNSRNLVGDGCTERTNAGLSDFGVSVVERMNELGVIVDVSHSGQQTTDDAIAISQKPVAVTHSFCKAIRRDHPRAKSDEQIKALADKGGVIGIAALGYFVGPDPGPGGSTTIESYVDHIDHAVKIGGIDHVGMSTDFAIHGLADWATKEEWYEPRLRIFKPSYQVKWPPWIPELDVPERFLNVTRILARRGYSQSDIEKILGLNWLRFFEDVIG